MESAFERLLAVGATIIPLPKGMPTFTDNRNPENAWPGQIWKTTPSTKNPETALTHWVLILHRSCIQGTIVYEIAPLFTETYMANQEDAILPQPILGFEAGIAFSLTLSTTEHCLNKCVLELPSEWTTQLHKFWQATHNPTKQRPAGIETGIPYLDQLDSRIEFHTELLEELTYLQKAVGPLI
jgi:hypothetical protein